MGRLAWHRNGVDRFVWLHAESQRLPPLHPTDLEPRAQALPEVGQQSLQCRIARVRRRRSTDQESILFAVPGADLRADRRFDPNCDLFGPF